MRTLADTIRELTRGSRSHELIAWRPRYEVRKYRGRVTGLEILTGNHEAPYEIVKGEGNLLLTVGATDLWNGLVTAGLATPYNSTNAQIAVGDASTGPAVGNTDMAAAVGSTDNTGDVSAATNATPIVLTVPSWTTLPVVGEVYVVAGVLGNTAAVGTFEVQAISATQMTLLGSAGNGGFATSAGSTVKKINKYRMLVNGAPVVSTNTVQFVSVFATANANHAWNEWGVSTGGAVTNKQAVPPVHLLNRSAPGGGLGTKTSAATWTFTVTLSLA